MKNKRWLKPQEIVEAIQEFELLRIIKNLETNKIIYFAVENTKGETLNIAPKTANIKLPEGKTLEDLKRGIRLRIRASKRKLKSRDNMIVFSEILEIRPKIQIDLEDLL